MLSDLNKLLFYIGFLTFYVFGTLLETCTLYENTRTIHLFRVPKLCEIVARVKKTKEDQGEIIIYVFKSFNFVNSFNSFIFLNYLEDPPGWLCLSCCLQVCMLETYTSYEHIGKSTCFECHNYEK